MTEGSELRSHNLTLLWIAVQDVRMNIHTLQPTPRGLITLVVIANQAAIGSVQFAT